MPGVETRLWATRDGKGRLGTSPAKGKAEGLQHRAPSLPGRRSTGDSGFVDRLDDYVKSKLRQSSLEGQISTTPSLGGHLLLDRLVCSLALPQTPRLGCKPGNSGLRFPRLTPAWVCPSVNLVSWCTDTPSRAAFLDFLGEMLPDVGHAGLGPSSAARHPRDGWAASCRTQGPVRWLHLER
uniref:Uncharacterized protein n=1 Tax=Molossus molossus TaxID=27622 RepID=A0A7J8E2Z9_MOLMO|nr:hypothetical protein HJG59_009080 [Molossus molossus]